MTENIPQSTVNPFLGIQKSSPDTQTVKLIEAPPEVISKGVIEGRVVAQENGRVTIATEQGQVVIEAKIAAEIGQKIHIRLQVAAQNAAQKIALEQLADLADIKQSDKAQISQKPAASDPVQILRPAEIKTFETVQARLVALPQAITKETFEILVKSMLQLPLSKEMPQTLQEGFTKFQQLSELLVQAKLVPQQSLQTSVPGQKVQQNVLTSILQILRPPEAGIVDKGGQFWTQNPLGFLQLQTIPPGQNLSPNILLDIRQQLLNVLQPGPLNAPAVLQQKPDITGMLSGLIKQTRDVIQNVIPNVLTGTENKPVPVQNAPLYTIPLTGIVMGQVPGTNAGSLILMATPQAQNLIGYVMQMSIPNPTPAQMIIPGTVMVMAMPPQTHNVMDMPSLFGMLPSLSKEALQALHPAFGQDWPALEDIWQDALGMQSTQPELMAHLRNIIPTTTPQQMTPAVLLFLALVKGGLGENWFDEKTHEALQKLDKAKAVTQLLNDMGSIRRAMDEGGTDAWKPLPMPFNQNDQLMRVQWYYRHQYDEAGGFMSGGEAEQKKKKTRFIVDVPQTKLGDIQIDGFVHDKVLDIVLRTDAPILKQAETAIRERYNTALEISGMVGQLQFQSGRDNYVQV